MREFSLANPERADCYAAVNFAPRGGRQQGFVINETLELAKAILKQLREGSSTVKDNMGEYRTFEGCNPAQIIKLKENEYDHLVQCLKGGTYSTVEKAEQIQELIGRLQDVPPIKEEDKKE